MKYVKPVIIAFVSLLIIGCSMALLGITAEMPDLSSKADGVYPGSFFNVILDVTVKNFYITRIDIIEHYHSPVGKNAEKIIDKIIQKQSLDVDTVTGATMSSRSILKAVENALQQEAL